MYVEGVTRWAGLLDALVTLLALAQIPEEKWGGESHNCRPHPLQNTLSLYDSGLHAKETGIPRDQSGLGATTLGQI